MKQTPGQRLASHTNTRRLTKQTTQGKKLAPTLKLGRNGMLVGDLLTDFFLLDCETVADQLKVVEGLDR